jgi:predicted Fe-Mo cluster-binding NifX family protein
MLRRELHLDASCIYNRDMKVAVSAAGKNPTSVVDSRFGRAPFFLIHDTDSDAWQVVENPHNQSGHGHDLGIKAAETLSRMGADAVISGHVCAGAFAALTTAAGLKVYRSTGVPVAQAVETLEGGQLSPMDVPDEE